MKLHRFTALEHRVLIAVRGSDTIPFLQGLVTQNVHNLAISTDKSGHGAYAMFLSAKGRVLFDSFLYKTEDAILVECNSQQQDSLLSYLKRHVLRSRVQVEPCNEKLYHAFPSQESLDLALSVDAEKMVTFDTINCEKWLRDTRHPFMGCRILSKNPACLNSLQEANLNAYHLWRMQLGVAEGPQELEQAVALEANLDVSGGVDFQKGCYVGQELTTRTHHRGVVRKRIVSVEISPNSNEMSFTTPVDIEAPESEGSHRVIGQILNSCQNVGIARIALDQCNRTDLLSKQGNNVFAIKPRIPLWWPSKIMANALS